MNKEILRYHPLLDLSFEFIKEYLEEFNLPQHPLAPLSKKNKISVGCEPCTMLNNTNFSKVVRGGRWAGLKKTECGLHTKLGVKK